MDALAETMADQQEIDDAIQSGGQLAVSAGGLEADEDELARELEGLVKEREEDDKAQEGTKAREEEQLLVDRMAALKPQGETEKTSLASIVDTTPKDRDTDNSGAALADKKWETVYEDAQARRAAEAARAEAGRLNREAKVYEVAS
jgi:charged multivesicular body protein 7